ncbi:Antirestriction protein (ArdA) [Phycisphaerae bacterium RAS1]|nr:Antirestriction protein (ArdA) [Phycisphaerae bacterium RAS1]
MNTDCTNETTPATETPRIYVASLADYNAGYLHGCWIDANQPVEAIREAVAKMLAASREPIAEDWAIYDYDNFGSLHLSEFEGLEHVADVARGMAEHGTLFAALLNHVGDASNVEEARRYMEEAYRGAFDSLADYASDFVKDCYADALKGLPDFIRYHIDYDGIGRDMELGGDVFTVHCGGKLHVFDAQI